MKETETTTKQEPKQEYHLLPQYDLLTYVKIGFIIFIGYIMYKTLMLSSEYLVWLKSLSHAWGV